MTLKGMPAATEQNHKVKKGDTLIGIAKKYKHKDWKTIWKDPANKKIVAKRKEPQHIEPGDTLVIPLNAQDKKANDKKLLELNQARNEEGKLYTAIEARIADTEKTISKYNDLISTVSETNQGVVGELNQSLKKMKRWSEIEGVAKFFLDMGGKIGSLVKLGKQASKASGDALKEINKKAADEVKKIKKDQLTDAGKFVIKQYKHESNDGLLAVISLIESWDKMTSPLFWANTYVQMTDNGKTWSQAVAMDIGDDLRAQIKQLEAQHAKRIKELKA